MKTKEKGPEKMIASTQNRTTLLIRVMALGFLLATLLAMVLSAVSPAGAAVTSGKAFSWGYNEFGQLGNGAHGSGTDTSTPANVIGLENVRSVSGGSRHSLAVLESGQARSWGWNVAGQLGNGDTDSDVPVTVKNLSNLKNIDGGYSFTLAATR